MCCTGTVPNARLSANDAELPDPRPPPLPTHSQVGLEIVTVYTWDAPYHTTQAGVVRQLRLSLGWEKRKDFMEVSGRQGNQPC